MLGTIALWSGIISEIPSGWALCDGTNGTPDLRDRFVIGAGLIYNQGTTGGALTHVHSVTTLQHRHVLADGEGVMAGATSLTRTDFQSPSGATDAQNHLPPYLALCYIMKMSA